MYLIEKVFHLFFVLGIICLTAVSTYGQPFDYEERPTFDFQFTEAQIDLKVNPQDGSINGSVRYSLKSNISGADTLRLDANGIEIDSVLSRGKSINFTTGNNGLQVVLADSSGMGEQHQVEIFYHTAPQFGLLKSSEGTLWTSMLPHSKSHWMPVKDHPRVQMVTTLSLQIPAELTAFASGVRTDNEVLSTSSKKVTFRSGRPIPITALAFGIGQFKEEGSSVGIKRINSYAEANSISPVAQKELINESKLLLGEIEQATGVDYPYQRLNIVILNDHYWEQKPYGASTIFLYKNRGDWTSQLQRGMYGQWFGVFQHEEQWAKSWPIFAMQTALHHKLSDSNALLKANRAEPETTFSTIYDQFSAERWNFWQQSQFWDSNAEQISGRLISQLLQQDSGIITPNTFENMWYDMSGQPAINGPDFSAGQNLPTNPASGDTVRYRLDYLPVQGSDQLQLAFNAQERSLQQPTTLPVDITTGGSTNETEVTFSGSVDTVSISISAGTQNVQVRVPDNRSLVFEEHKPVPYLLYQLRNAETTEARKKAALGLGYHTENPDLQLALNDVMQQDMEPEVEAALLRSYGKITDGAEGTQKRFLEALQHENPAIRAAALQVLTNYDDEGVTQQLRTFSERETDELLSNEALNIYMQRVDSTAALQFTNSLVQQDTAGTKAIVAIDALAERGNTQKAVELANYYIEPVYSYPVRKMAFQILLANDTSADAWKERINTLLNDADPRIRFLAVNNLPQIPGVDAKGMIESRRSEEYDARVLRAMSRK